MTGSDSLRLPNGRLRSQKSLKARSKACALLHQTGVQGVLYLGSLLVHNVGQVNSDEIRSSVFGFEKSRFSGVEPLFYNRQNADYYRRSQIAVALEVPESAKRQGFAIHRYLSGEITGARFTTGLCSQGSLPLRSGAVVTQSLTQKARTKIRRSIQNAECDFQCFMTVTFAPQYLLPWQCNIDGSVRHDFAKYKFKKFLNTISHACSRKAKITGRFFDNLSYVWVAEIQQKTTKNIHFHVLLNQRLPIKWLTRIWGQSSNCIDVRSINNLNHASCYLRKYMEKEKSSIQGNRYGITQNLRESMRPIKTVINGRSEQQCVYSIISYLSDTIEINGGKVLDHGFYIPVPTRSVKFLGKDGTIKQTVPVSSGLSHHILKKINNIIPELPF